MSVEAGKNDNDEHISVNESIENMVVDQAVEGVTSGVQDLASGAPDGYVANSGDKEVYELDSALGVVFESAITYEEDRYDLSGRAMTLDRALSQVQKEFESGAWEKWLPEVVLVDDGVLPTETKGAYSASENIIFIDKKLSTEEMDQVYLEEVGHAIDRRIGELMGIPDIDAQNRGDWQALYEQSGGRWRRVDNTAFQEANHNTIFSPAYDRDLSKFGQYSLGTVMSESGDSRKAVFTKNVHGEWIEAHSVDFFIDDEGNEAIFFRGEGVYIYEKDENGHLEFGLERENGTVTKSLASPLGNEFGNGYAAGKNMAANGEGAELYRQADGLNNDGKAYWEPADIKNISNQDTLDTIAETPELMSNPRIVLELGLNDDYSDLHATRFRLDPNNIDVYLVDGKLYNVPSGDETVFEYPTEFNALSGEKTLIIDGEPLIYQGHEVRIYVPDRGLYLYGPSENDEVHVYGLKTERGTVLFTEDFDNINSSEADLTVAYLIDEVTGVEFYSLGAGDNGEFLWKSVNISVIISDEIGQSFYQFEDTLYVYSETNGILENKGLIEDLDPHYFNGLDEGAGGNTNLINVNGHFFHRVGSQDGGEGNRLLPLFHDGSTVQGHSEAFFGMDPCSNSVDENLDFTKGEIFFIDEETQTLYGYNSTTYEQLECVNYSSEQEGNLISVSGNHFLRTDYESGGLLPPMVRIGSEESHTIVYDNVSVQSKKSMVFFVDKGQLRAFQLATGNEKTDLHSEAIGDNGLLRIEGHYFYHDELQGYVAASYTDNLQWVYETVFRFEDQILFFDIKTGDLLNEGYTDIDLYTHHNWNDVKGTRVVRLGTDTNYPYLLMDNQGNAIELNEEVYHFISGYSMPPQIKYTFASEGGGVIYQPTTPHSGTFLSVHTEMEEKGATTTYLNGGPATIENKSEFALELHQHAVKHSDEVEIQPLYHVVNGEVEEFIFMDPVYNDAMGSKLAVEAVAGVSELPAIEDESFEAASTKDQVLQGSEAVARESGSGFLTKEQYQEKTFHTRDGSTIYYTWQNTEYNPEMEKAGTWSGAQIENYSNDFSLGKGLFVSTNPYDSAHYSNKPGGTVLYEIIVESSRDEIYVEHAGGEATWRVINSSILKSIIFRRFTGEGMDPSRIKNLAQDIDNYSQFVKEGVGKPIKAMKFINGRISELEHEAQKNGVELGEVYSFASIKINSI